jgi:hypothetical protein
VQCGSGDAVVQIFEDGKGEGLLFLLRFAPGPLGGDQIGEERVQAGGSAGSGETVGADGLAECSLEPESGCLDVASDSAGAWMFGAS